jgi:DNA-binding beta-propeller fold protein YncE
MNAHRLHCVAMVLISVFSHNAGAQTPDDFPGNDVRCVVDPSWPQKPESFTWGAMSGVTVDAEDRVYIFNRSEPTVQVYERDGALVRSWSTANPSGTHHIKLDPDGNVWLADFRSHVVQKYSPDGKLLLTLGEAGQPGCDESHFAGPTDMAFLPNGEVFISDGYGNRRVVHCDKQGRFVKAWGEEGSGPGQFALPHAIAIDSTKRLYVADRNNARIQVFDTEGRLLAVWDDLLMPWGFAVTESDEIWVCGSSRVKHPSGEGWVITPPPDQLLMKLNRAGEVLLRVPLDMTATAPGKPGEVDWVHAVAADSKGNIYLGDIQGKRIQKFSLHYPAVLDKQ